MLTADDPEPVLFQGSAGGGEILLTCEHGGQSVPRALGDLGVSSADMQRHIAWDIGTEWVARQLCERLSCAGLICVFSRLVIDATRDERADGLIPNISDGTPRPGHANWSHFQRQERIDRLERLSKELGYDSPTMPSPENKKGR